MTYDPFPIDSTVMVRRRGDRKWLRGTVVETDCDFRLVHREDNRIMLYTIDSLAKHEYRFNLSFAEVAE